MFKDNLSLLQFSKIMLTLGVSLKVAYVSPTFLMVLCAYIVSHLSFVPWTCAIALALIVGAVLSFVIIKRYTLVEIVKWVDSWMFQLE